VIRSAIVLNTMMERDAELAHDIDNQGPSVTASVENAREFLRRYNRNQLDASQIATALLFMVMTPNGEQYQANVWVQALRDHGITGQRWHEVVRAFDREGLVVDSSQFLALYRALEPVALDDSSFDIQQMWGGHWNFKATQLSFAVAYASLTPAQLNAEDIPNLRMAYDPREWDDVPEEWAHYVKEAVQDPMISIDAVTAIIEGLWDPKEATAQDITQAKQVVAEKITFFLASAGAIPKPWVDSQQSLMNRIFVSCINRQQNDYEWILHCLWKEDRSYVATRMIEIHAHEPLLLPSILDHAQEHGWTNDLLTMLNGFGIDLAALAHRRGLRDLKEWVEPKVEQHPTSAEVTNGLGRFLVIKAQDELRVVREEQERPRTEPLAIGTIYAMLEIIDEQMKEQKQETVVLKRTCMQSFPRLCNYGEGFDAIIDANGADGHRLPPSADAEMQDLYKKMYNSEVEVRQVIEILRDCKTSEDPSRQDVFACMIHGLFDEYVCFNEYPLTPLATTAVLFGGIINYGILSRFTLDVALEMVHEAVRDYPPESSMFKFGLQALMHFKGRLREWRDVAQSLVQIPGLQGTPIYGPAQDALRDGGASPPTDNNEGAQGKREVNGNMDEFLTDSLVPQFRSVNPDIPVLDEQYEDPEESIQDQILFVLNNLTDHNLSSKGSLIADSLQPKHYQWFASYIVDQRAKSQPNYQGLYLDLLNMLADKGLWADVLRETYGCVRRVLNSEATMKSAAERTHLKNLGAWLGSLTIARDKPIKHKNIAFKELLIEGWETQRLLLVIPFTCEVLAQGSKSIVFKPPNPWIMEVVGLLLELYDLPDLKIQQKFAVEVLLGTFGLPRNGNGLERTSELKKRQQRYQSEMGETVLSDGLESFPDMSLGNLNRNLRNTRLSPSEIESTLPDLSELLVFPPPSSSPINSNRLRQIVQTAVQRSIMEIIGPVVERSVTIATIATKDLVIKDYGQEPNEAHVREAFEMMSKATSGSLAAVTCKEPLRMSITNFLRNAGAEMPNEPIPEGVILMCVNDNLEIACRIVQQQAEERALPEIKAVIEDEIRKRQDHKANYPNEPYRDPNVSSWSSYLPEPYKQMPGGLTQQQLDIYAQFAPQNRNMAIHNQTASTDSGKQIPDVLQETGFPNVPNLSTPAEPPAVPHQPQPQMPPSNVQLPLPSARTPSQVNGYMDGASVQEHIETALQELARLTHTFDAEQKVRTLPRDSPVLSILSRVLNMVRSSQDPDGQAFWVAGALHRTLYTEADNNSKFDTAVLVQALKEVCLLSSSTYAKVHLALQKSNDDQVLVAPITAALLEAEILEYPIVDAAYARLLLERKTQAVDAFEKLLDYSLFSNEPAALRGDFAHSLGVLGEWLAEAPDLETGARIMSKLKSSGISDAEPSDGVGQERLQYIFSEWMTLYGHPVRSDSLTAAFVAQLQQQGVVESQVDLARFLKVGIETATETFERITVMNPSIDMNEAHFEVDAFARLVVMLVKAHGGASGKAAYFKSVLFLTVLVLNNHQIVRGEHFNQRTYFRFFSSVFYDWHELIRGADPADDKNTILAFADTILLLDPNAMSAFTFGWLQLISHRVFMPAVLKDADSEVSYTFPPTFSANESRAPKSTHASWKSCCRTSARC
jgi:CCR4-NOT transcription complex subunit 1